MHLYKNTAPYLSKVFLPIFILGAIFWATDTLSVHAYTISKLNVENNEDFVVEPGKTEIFLNPGETITKTISVTNRTNRPLDYNVSVENFVGSDNAETTVVLLPSGTDTPYPLDEYVSTEINEFTLQFGERITFQVTVTVPNTIEPGGHYGAIIISNESNGPSSVGGDQVQGGAQLTSRIGSLILMRINGDVKESGNLKTFDVSGPDKWFFQKMPTDFEIAFQNDGSVHLVPYGTITIKNIFGSEITQVPVDAYFALPGAIRYQNVTWPGKKFSFGYYSAELELYKGYGNQFDNNKISFFVFPFIIVIPAIVLFILIFGVIYFVSKRFEFRRK